ncbi:LPXTG cell wall anchor domain-containing protein [Microbacterium sp. NPDC089320]|uniref:LPXTG cell wall anchor domain-containing protein n=1 Tax=Microbacterium sp. NPDC089320 TaxID=3155182 RepID=UPI00342458D8
MYGANPPIVGTALGGTLAATGGDSTWPLIIVAVCLTSGALLMIRDSYLRRTADDPGDA